MKISSFMISILLVGAIVVSFILAITDLATKHSVTYEGTDVAEDMSRLYNKSLEIQDTVDEMNKKETDMKPSSGVFDVIGDYLNKGYSVLKITKQSGELFSEMTRVNMFTEKLHIPAYFPAVFAAIIVILIIVTVILKALLKVDL